MSGELTAFFYGTLMAPEVFFGVCYGNSNPPQVIKDLHTFTPAVLDGYCRHRVQFADYPGVIRQEGHSVLGIYATGLTEANLLKLDYFEGSEYDKETVQVKLLKRDENETKETDTKTTTVYVFNNPKHLEKGEWDFKKFRDEKLPMWTRGELDL